MPYVSITESQKSRYLISGLQNSGKTRSLITFLYGRYDYLDESQRADAVSYAAGKSMVVIAAPGEFGTRKTLEQYVTEQAPGLEVYEYEASEGDDITSPSWSHTALQAFNTIYRETIKNKPDTLAIDGLHSLWEQGMNLVTDGAFLSAEALSNVSNPYAKADFYDRAHNTFGQYISALYTSPIPLVVCTTWEDWKNTSSDSQKSANIADRRFLWPDIPGKMATRVVGKFDARISTKIGVICYSAKDSKGNSRCSDYRSNKQHYLWQFHPKDDVQGVGIKGLRLTQEMMATPYIHQNYESLKALIARKAR